MRQPRRNPCAWCRAPIMTLGRHDYCSRACVQRARLARLVDANRDDMSLPGRVRYYRALAGWTQDELADRAQVARHTIQNAEVGRHYPTKTVIRLLSDALGVSTAALKGVK